MNRKLVEPFILLICGDRVWRQQYEVMIHKEVADFKERLGKHLMILHGNCAGVDTIAGEAARYHGIPEIRMPAQWDFYHRSAGPIRNSWMLWLHPKLVVGYHVNWDESRGTVDMLKRAAAKKIQVVRRTIRVSNG